MSSRDLSAGQLRYHLQELSVSVARRLIAVLDAARDAPHGVAAELDAVVTEITDIQRELAYEMAGPPLGGAADLSSLSRMLELQQRMMHLLDRIETLSSRPITTYLEQRQRTPLEEHGGWTAPPGSRASAPYHDEPQPDTALAVVRNWEQPHPAYAQVYEGVHQRAALGAHGAETAPFLARSLGTHVSGGATGTMMRWPHMSPAARWGLLPMAICIVSALLTTTVNRLLQGDPAGILTHSDSVAKRGDRLDARAVPEERASAAPERPQAPLAARLEQPERIAPAAAPAQSAVITVSPPPPSSDRGLDALNPDAPSVAVLTTHQDPAVARQTFLTLKERFPDILGTAEAEIEAVQTQDGATWHRVSLVPPVPRTEAKDLCKRLRAAGYSGCWVKARSSTE
jgi:hypothetical protein